jgi:hypothetical protein
VSSKQYVKQVHTHASFSGVFEDHKWPIDIVLHVGTHVWVSASYADETPAGVVRVGDSRSNGYDEDGNCILSVPVEMVKEYFDEEEVSDIVQAVFADEKLLTYARG